jgi:hypothetical protein
VTGARRLILPAAAVAAVFLCAGLAFALTSRPPSPPNPAVTATAPASPAGAASPGGQSQPRVPWMSLASVLWSSFYGVELPVSTQAGPFITSEGIASGFAHTPLGALLAAVNIGVRANAQWGPRIFTEVIRRQVTGPDAAALLAACQSAYDQAAQAGQVAGGQPLGPVHVTEQGFRWITYTPAAAILDLAVAGPGDSGATVRASVQMEVVWDGGDWKAVAPPGGDWGNSAAELSSLAGYTAFPGRGGGR